MLVINKDIVEKYLSYIVEAAIRIKMAQNL